MNEWIDIKTMADAEIFLNTSHYLHDFFLREAHLLTPAFAGSPTSITLVFHDTWHNDKTRIVFELRFDEVTRFNFVPRPCDVDSIIHGCLLTIIEESGLWCEDEDFTGSDPGEKDQITWISAKHISWRNVDRD